MEYQYGSDNAPWLKTIAVAYIYMSHLNFACNLHGFKRIDKMLEVV